MLLAHDGLLGIIFLWRSHVNWSIISPHIIRNPIIYCCPVVLNHSSLEEWQLWVAPKHTKDQLSHLASNISWVWKAISCCVLLPFFFFFISRSSLCSGLNVICCVSISLSTWAVSRRTRSRLHLVSADSSLLCLWLFGSQSALAKHATETGKELPLRLAVALLATSTQGGLKPTFCSRGGCWRKD